MHLRTHRAQCVHVASPTVCMHRYIQKWWPLQVGVPNIWLTQQKGRNLLFVGQRCWSFLINVKEGYAAVLYKGIIMNHTQQFNRYLITIEQHLKLSFFLLWSLVPDSTALAGTSSPGRCQCIFSTITGSPLENQTHATSCFYTTQGAKNEFWILKWSKTDPKKNILEPMK